MLSLRPKTQIVPGNVCIQNPNLFHNSRWKVSHNLHLAHSVASNDDVLGGFSYIANLAWITPQVSRPACFGHVVAVLAQCPAKRLHASLQSRLTSGLMGLSDTSLSASVCFCMSDVLSATAYGWLVLLFLVCAFLCSLTMFVCPSSFS